MSPAMEPYRITLSLFFFFFFANVQSTCYFPNGRESPTDTPCNSSGGHSTCCGRGYACLSNGLCAVSEYLMDKDFSWDTVWYSRGTCTDSLWNDPACPKFCITTSEGDDRNGGMGIANCQFGTKDRYYCLNSSNKNKTIQDLCFGKQNSFTPGGRCICLPSNACSKLRVANPTTITVIGASPTSTPSSSSTPSSTPTSPPPPKQKDLSTAIGAGVGVPLGILALVVGIFLFFRYRRLKSHMQANSGSIFEGDVQLKQNGPPPIYASQGYQEFPAHTQEPRELLA